MIGKAAKLRHDTSYESTGFLSLIHTYQMRCGSVSATGVGSGSSTDCPAVPGKPVDFDVL